MTEKYFLATTTAPHNSLLLGSRLWTVHNDSAKCSENGSYSILLTMTGCNDTQYTCYDGRCVSMDRRCDGKVDCEDDSDEEECKIVSPDKGYKKIVPPPTQNNGEILPINLTIIMKNIFDINVIESTFSTKFIYVSKWYDKRLTYMNLKRDTKLNQLDPNEKKLIWTPWITFENIIMYDSVHKTDIGDTILITPNSKQVYLRDNTHPNNVYIFSGSENALERSLERSVTWMCEYDMAWYPFDTQTCTMQFVIKNLILVPEDLEYTGPTDLAQYFVRSVKMCSGKLPGHQTVNVLIIFGRRLMSNILTIFIPTIILLILSHFAQLYEENYFDLVIGVNLTVLLVLATL